jgi:two-component system cell cycle sensor histidine kinase/response regulator CckA
MTRVLVVENEIVIAKDLQLTLNSLGYEVPALAPTGADAIQLAGEMRPDVVLMDIVLKGDMDGIQAAERIRTRYDVPVIFLTAYADDDTLQRAKITEPFGYILKPFEERELHTNIQMALYKHQIERRLRTSEKRLRSVVEQSVDGIVLTDEQGTIIEWNQGMENITGVPRAEVQGIPLWQAQSQLTPKGLSYAAPDETIRADLTTYLATDRGTLANRLREASLQTRDGAHRTVQTSLFPIQTETGYMLGNIVRDVTEQKQLESQVHQQERLAAVGQLAGGIAHDFNNFLTTITLYADILRRRTDLPTEVGQDLTTIADESRAAARLVQQILDFSRCAMIDSKPVDLVELVQKNVDILRRTLPENIQLHFEIGAGQCVVEADSTRIQQVLMNLCTNARDAMPDGGDLLISLTRLTVDGEHGTPLPDMGEGDWVCLAVSDSGTGMTDEVLSHTFEPFFTTKDVGVGTGLGLAQVYGIVTQHGGHIGVQTHVGAGSTFRAYLPAYYLVTQAATSTASAPPPVSGGGETILLVEDETQVREAARRVLLSCGYQVLACENGRQALQEFASAQNIDLVITDMVMPEMGGKALMQELRTRYPLAKGLAITGYALEEDMRDLREMGIVGILHKPFDTTALAEAVHTALDEQ